MALPRPICLTFDRQTVLRACSRAWAKTGNRIAARIAIIAMTTSNSIKVNPLLGVRLSQRCIASSPLREQNGFRRSQSLKKNATSKSTARIDHESRFHSRLHNRVQVLRDVQVSSGIGQHVLMVWTDARIFLGRLPPFPESPTAAFARLRD